MTHRGIGAPRVEFVGNVLFAGEMVVFDLWGSPALRGIEAAERRAAMERKYEVGSPVKYVDRLGQPHDALVTCWWETGYPTGNPNRGCNLIFVSGDPAKDDTYGRQIERETSVIHRSGQPAPGNYWCWPDEL